MKLTNGNLQEDLVSVPIYLKLRNILHKRIRVGEFKSGDKLPSERAMSKQYGISYLTVNKAVASLVDEGILYRETGKGTFVAKESSWEISREMRTQNIAVVGSITAFNSGEPFYSRVLRGIESSAYREDYNVILATADKNGDQTSSLLKVVTEKKADAIIFVGKIDDSIIADVKRRGLPFVLVDHYLSVFEADAVLIDNRRGLREAMKYLYRIGHREYGYIRSDDDKLLPSLRERFEEFLTCLNDYGLSGRYENFVTCEMNHAGGDRGAARIWESDFRPTAILTANDEMAIGALGYFSENAIRVPGDVSVVGFDDIMWSEYTHPPLTTVRVPKSEMGELAVDLLLDTTGSGRFAKDEHVEIRVPTELIVRETTCSPREKHTRRKDRA